MKILSPTNKATLFYKDLKASDVFEFHAKLGFLCMKTSLGYVDLETGEAYTDNHNTRISAVNHYSEATLFLDGKVR